MPLSFWKITLAAHTEPVERKPNSLPNFQKSVGVTARMA